MENRYVQLHTARIERLRLEKGLSREELIRQTDLTLRTGRRALSGRSIRFSTAREIADALGIEGLAEIANIRADEIPDQISAEPNRSGVNEWNVAQWLTEWHRASNGLNYQICRMQHAHVPESQARGKCYELNFLSDAERRRIQTALVRHPRICQRVGRHANIITNITTVADERQNCWWVIDEWISETTMARYLDGKQLPTTNLSPILRQVAEGLQTLHKADIVWRELSPDNILMKDDHSPVLCEFELGKLLDGGTTVAPTESWPVDEFRAPEVEGNPNVDARADIYSWGRLAVLLACGSLPASPRACTAMLGNASLPKRIVDLIAKCIARSRAQRPATIQQVLRGLRNWK